MGLARKAVLTFCSLCALARTAPVGWGAEIEYISPVRQSELGTLFQQAKFDSRTDGPRLSARDWICDMYGMRTRLQVHHGLRLYHWAAGSSWRNEGSQPIPQYVAGPLALTGVTSRLEDQVRITADGRLVSRLTDTALRPTLIAYSICTSVESRLNANSTP